MKPLKGDLQLRFVSLSYSVALQALEPKSSPRRRRGLDASTDRGLTERVEKCFRLTSSLIGSSVSRRPSLFLLHWLAFLANEKRANLPWKVFWDEVAKHFGDEIIAGKIARHVIDDHYRGMWADLVEAAGQAIKQPKSRLVFSRLGKTVPKK